MAVWSACILALVANVAAVPMSPTQSRSFSVSMRTSASFVDATDLAQLGSALTSTALAGFDAAVDVSVETAARRQLQAGVTALRVSYVIACGSSCDAVTAAITTLATDPAAGEAHATALITAINAAATAAGFSSPVVVSTAADLASTITPPTTVTIILPGGGGDTPAPAPVQTCVGPIESGNTQTYDNILTDLPLGSDKAITFTVQVCVVPFLFLSFLEQPFSIVSH